MSEPVTKQRPTIDLDDFERRLRQTHARIDDPLTELARLVGEQPDPYGDVFARDADVQPVDDVHLTRAEPSMGREARGAAKPSFADFAAIEAGLRGAMDPQGHVSHPMADLVAERDPPGDAYHAHAYPEHGYPEHAYQDPTFPGHTFPDQGEPSAMAAPQEWAGSPAYGEPPSRANRKPMYLMAATIAVGVIGIGTAFALKSHVGTSPREVRTIMADAGPTKIQPPAEASTDQTGQDAALLGKGGQAAPTKLVDREEQPINVSQAVSENAARLAAGAQSDAASVPVPPSPGQAAMSNGGTAPEPQGFASDVTPKHVKVVSVRPDGSVIADEQPVPAQPAAAAPAPRQQPAKTSDRSGPVAKAATPKSTVRVAAATPKSIEQLSGDDAPAPASKPAKKAKPQRVASADSGAPETEVAPAVASSGGGFAVQLAAPGSETEAKTVSSRLGKKYAGVLAGHRLGFHEAQSNGRSVYRVRVSSLSREDAVSLCEKLKADGGSCFVARN